MWSSEEEHMDKRSNPIGKWNYNEKKVYITNIFKFKTYFNQHLIKQLEHADTIYIIVKFD